MNTGEIEDQETRLVKSFIDRYKGVFLLGLCVLLTIIGGARYWHSKTMSTSQRASDAFQEMLVADLKGEQKQAIAKAAYIVEDFPRSPYAQFAALQLAKIYANDGDLDAAADRLRWVIQQPSAKKFAGSLATLRLAAILQAQGNYSQALELLEVPKDSKYASLFAEARGDIFLAQQEVNKAKEAYMQAMYSLVPGMQAPILQMKLVDLGVNDNA